MRNITVRVSEDVSREARIQAAMRGQSVSGLVAAYLRGVSNAANEFDRLERLQQDVLAQIGAFSAAGPLSRDDAHDRPRP